jgi:hypothetical protein
MARMEAGWERLRLEIAAPGWQRDDRYDLWAKRSGAEPGAAA